ncbi:FAD binding domain-containing protein [Pseudonocardia spinosispora]|uniref:FAD binding domain-containing protein n=1 Tax=Pseudonocardia spinosispora TaxID=103441 RepID=UPI0004147CC2|nr:FAD binding domain-containing protein [Pseudonocardia spinosispora]
MDLDTVRELGPWSAHGWRDGDAWLAGGTWLFSEPQPAVRRLVDLTEMGWASLRQLADGSLEIGATCTVAELSAYPHPLFLPCCRAFLASFKIWNVATVGGNLCAALPAGPMISLCAALEGRCLLLAQDGGRRVVPVSDFVRGAGRTVLGEGELLRSITLPAHALRRRSAMRQASLYELGRSAALVIGTRDPAGGATTVTVTASTVRPFQLGFPGLPGREELAEAIERTVPPSGWFSDVHGLPRWRRHMTHRLAEQVRRELSEPT